MIVFDDRKSDTIPEIEKREFDLLGNCEQIRALVEELRTSEYYDRIKKNRGYDTVELRKKLKTVLSYTVEDFEKLIRLL